MVQSAEHATEARIFPGSSLGHSLLFGQNLVTCVSCEQIGKKLKTVIALACTSVMKPTGSKLSSPRGSSPHSSIFRGIFHHFLFLIDVFFTQALYCLFSVRQDLLSQVRINATFQDIGHHSVLKLHLHMHRTIIELLPLNFFIKNLK